MNICNSTTLYQLFLISRQAHDVEFWRSLETNFSGTLEGKNHGR